MMKFSKIGLKRFFFKLSVILLILIVVYNIFYIYIILSRVKIDTVQSSTNSIKVLTFNVEYGFTELIFNQISKIDADIVAFQEANPAFINSSFYTMDQVADFLNMYYLPSEQNTNQIYGLAIFSKWEITDSNIIHYKDQPGTFPRGLEIAQVQSPYGLIEVMNTHLSFPTSVSARYRQVNTIIDYVNQDIPTLVAGDFNTPASLLDPSYWKLSSRFSDGWIASGGNLYAGRTWNKDIQILRVDYIWLTNQWSIIEDSGRLYESQESDHLGFSVDIVLN
ncbi:MAG: hypothetical protein HeimC2_31210 [Candidatus Heimdallarchaeota archaeon LC_2]|nr:MAG: hypothetical protein HeimC2_31210 [Candidatus Heimdallarchaeota archaeon LC_2]